MSSVPIATGTYLVQSTATLENRAMVNGRVFAQDVIDLDRANLAVPAE